MHILKKRKTEQIRYLSLGKLTFLLLLVSVVTLPLIFVFVTRSLAREATSPEKYDFSAESLLALMHGRELIEKERHLEAAEYLNKAYQDLPPVRDYILFFRAKALNGIEQFNESGHCIAEILRQFPESPLLRKARTLQLNNILRTNKSFPKMPNLPPSLQTKSDFSDIAGSAINHLESFIRDYPDDAEMTFSLARLYKLSGNSERARKLFVQVYISNSPFSEAAHREIRQSDLTSRDLLLKVTNYLKSYDSKEAEQLIRKMLPEADKSLKGELHQKLGLSLFRQKKYPEASSEFIKGGDLYSAARAYFRAGDMVSFSNTVSKLGAMEDKRAGNLMLAYASKKRRAGKTNDALDIYQTVKSGYPSLTEDALWGIAWTNYRARNYQGALDSFTILSNTFASSRSQYWKTKTIEQLKEQAGDCTPTSLHESESRQTSIPRAIRDTSEGLRDDFYVLLGKMRSQGELTSGTLKTVSNPRPEFKPLLHPARGTTMLPPLDRFVILQAVGMDEDATIELLRIAKSVSQPDALMEIVLLLQKTGSYKKSLSLISRITDNGTWYDRKMANSALYPFAFWPAVREFSIQYQLDPLIVLSVIREESRFDPSARSVAGALGLMQIMPQTAHTLNKKLGIKISTNTELFDVRKNISLGTYYLHTLLREFGSLPVAIAAYNAGEEKVREWIHEGHYSSVDEFIEDIPFDETRNYVKKVLMTYATYISLAEEKRND